tara:strand:+ start:1447 stop:2505 length:1059 start_codon:yes stop_codon:yes gene_type:complete
MVISKDFWKNKKVLVTGHTGFKGSWLTVLLNQLGSKVYGISLKEESVSLAKDISLENYCDSKIIDLRNRDSVLKEINKINPDIVFHLAAQSLVIKSYNDPYLTYSSNLLGLVNTLDSLRSCSNTKVILNVTSDKCYKNLESLNGYKEDDILGGHDPYSNSKACSELISESFRESFFKNKNIACITARAGNVIGGGDWSENRLIPDVFRSILNNQNLEIRNPDSVRPWQHVLEPLIGYLLLAEKAYFEPVEYSEAWNFGPDQDNIRTVGDIVNEISKHVDIQNRVKYQDNADFHETNILKLDISKVKSRINWEPRWGFEKTIEKTCLWYKEYLSKNNIKNITLKQINEYLDII